MTNKARLALDSLLAAAGWSDAPTDRVEIAPTETALATAFPIADMAAAGFSALGLAADALRTARGAAPQQIQVDRRHASLAMTAATYLTIDGEAAKTWDPITGYYRAEDGGWVYLHANFPHLRDGLLAMFEAPNDRAALAERIAARPAQAIEDEAARRGLCAVRLRTREEWAAHPQKAALDAMPVVSIKRIGEAPPEPAGAGPRPAEGVRALDLTRVLAGPMCGRALIELGATVMRIAGPHLPFIEPLVIDTGHGKLSAHVDLRAAEGVARLEALAREADLFIAAYRPGALAARGFGWDRLAALRPGIVGVAISAFSDIGPWAGRRGYDTYVQAPTGLAGLGPDGRPARLPCQPLDYLSGCLAAYGACVALRRRAEEGGSWLVELSLARTAAWVWEMTDLLEPEPAPPAANPPLDAVEDCSARVRCAFGEVRSLRTPLRLPETPLAWDRPPVPLGTHAAAWPG